MTTLQGMTQEDQVFEQCLRDFKREFYSRESRLDAHMKEAKRIIESGRGNIPGLSKGFNVRHFPISARRKEDNKALRTLRRRQKERVQLKTLRARVMARRVETGQHDAWESYCRRWNMEDKINEVIPFTDMDEDCRIDAMFDAMPDLAGLRISLYFPGDVDKVIVFLKDNFEIVQGPSRKGGLSRQFQTIRKLVEQEENTNIPTGPEQGALMNGANQDHSWQSTFAGYKATHVIVRMKEGYHFDDFTRGDKPTNIEIQIGSIIMHAWSDIEHDILYKPSEGETVSDDVTRMLDLINGIVITGEVALQQLGAVAASEANAREQERKKEAQDFTYLPVWLDNYFADKPNTKHFKRDYEWSGTRCLHLLLKASNNHNFGRLEQLLNSMEDVTPDASLPLRIQALLGADQWPIEHTNLWTKHNDSALQLAWTARYWVTCLNHTATMALFLGRQSLITQYLPSRSNEFLSEFGKAKNTLPTFAEYLDILHPRYPHYKRDLSRTMMIIDFCQYLLKSIIPTDTITDQIHYNALHITKAGYVARPRLSDEEERNLSEDTVVVSFLLKWLTPEPSVFVGLAISEVDPDLKCGSNESTSQLFFVPQSSADDDFTWKATKARQMGLFDVNMVTFDMNSSLKFGVRNAIWTQHICELLGADLTNVQALNDLVYAEKGLALAGPRQSTDWATIWPLKGITLSLGTVEKDRVAEFLDVSRRLGVKGPLANRVLATQVKALQTTDTGQLEVFRKLAQRLKVEDLKEQEDLAKLFPWMCSLNEQDVMEKWESAKMLGIYDSEELQERLKSHVLEGLEGIVE
ncbi:hypothetical protein M406DRAFT_74939 [Cryphonectria parasitica EP155]|uniref:RelA/SpoT domain-containing protein n=1 Tax=Cryphonectria parasitica (strain ATCC 38755 / EP155) TaxID=660469 RepID=A0A9P5CLH4_CRYP1|nr:uncharacterized protein M406DRAFT_74939 [Cryphonectria parasitica EP155]KAF3762021.1 hypothetical protein M406DRAFT_74939 [Cryphonectria parasitica EP155]